MCGTPDHCFGETYGWTSINSEVRMSGNNLYDPPLFLTLGSVKGKLRTG